MGNSLAINIQTTYHRERGRKEAEGVYYWSDHIIGYTLYVLANVLARGYQQGCHQQQHKGETVVQLEHNIIDNHTR